MIAGVTNIGFVRPPRSEIETYVDGLILPLATDPSGNQPNLVAPEFWGIEKGVNVALYEHFIQILERMYYDLFILSASGVELDRRAYPTLRLQPGKSQGTLSFTGGLAGGTISHSSVFEVEDGRQYQLINDLVLDVYGEGTASAQSVLTGELANQDTPIGSVRFIPVPITGMPLLQVTNAAAFLDSRGIESDPDFRTRAVENNAIEKTSSLPAMRAALLQVPGVTAVFGYENLTETFDVDGVPPGGIVMTAKSGADLAIATSIYNTKPAGNPSWGTVTTNVTDPTNGIVYPIKYGRVTSILIYVAVTKTVDGTYNAAVSDNVIRQQILNYIGGVNPQSVTSEGVNIGEKVYAWKAKASCFELNNTNMIPGLLDLTVLIGLTTGDRTHADLTMTSTQEAYTDFSSISVA